MHERQRATAMYLIDRFALRAGNEKGDDEADTVGCCTLRCEHLTLIPPNRVIFDFLGKDSIRYHREVDVDVQVWKNLKLFMKKPKSPSDPLFDRLTTTSLNKYLSSLMPGLTAKVFRTFNASHTFQEELKKTPKVATIQEKILAYNRANREVAVLCNHQRAVPKQHENQMERMQNKIRALKYQRWRLKRELLQLEPKMKQTHPTLVEPESDLDEAWCIAHEEELVQKEREKAEAKIEKENAKRQAANEPPLTKEEEEEIRAKADELMEKFKAERKEGAKLEIRKGVTVEKLEEKIMKMTERIIAAKAQMIDRDENKTTALGTSKINYLDPRITAAWCRKHQVPLEKMFNATLREKFRWAMDMDSDWEF
jgi:DNA topoisomerase-1